MPSYLYKAVTDNSPEFPIANTSGVEMSIGAATDGTNFLVGIQGDDVADHNITAQLVSASTGSLVGSRISVGRGGGAPHVAFDGTNYMMVWPDDLLYPNDKIYGQRFDTSGQLVGGPFAIGSGVVQTHNGINKIVFDGANYFVVWDQSPAWEGCTDEYGQFVSPSGSLLGSPLKINTTPCGGGGVTVSFDGARILAAWGSEWNQSGVRSACGSESSCDLGNIWGQFIAKSEAGTAGTLSGANFSIFQGNTFVHLPSIAFDGSSTYLVVFPKEPTLPVACPGGCKADIFGQLVTKEGALSGSTITVSNTSANHEFAQAAFVGTNYLVSWTDGWGTTSPSTKGLKLDASGNTIGSEFTLFSAADDGSIPWLAVPFVSGSNYFTIVNRGIPGIDPFNIMEYTNANVYGKVISP